MLYVINKLYKINDEERIVSFSANKMMKIWSEKMQKIKIFESYTKEELITTIKFSPEGDYLFLGDINGNIYKLTYIVNICFYYRTINWIMILHSFVEIDSENTQMEGKLRILNL